MPLRFSDLQAFPGLIQKIPPPQGYAIAEMEERGRNKRDSAGLRLQEFIQQLRADVDREAEGGRNSRAATKEQRERDKMAAEEAKRKQELVGQAENLRLKALDTGDPQLRGEMLDTVAELYRAAGHTTGPEHGMQGTGKSPGFKPQEQPPPAAAQPELSLPPIKGMMSRVKSGIDAVLPGATAPASPALQQAQGDLFGERMGRGIRGFLSDLATRKPLSPTDAAAATPAAPAPPPMAHQAVPAPVEPSAAGPTVGEQWAVHDRQGRTVSEVSPEDFDRQAAAEFDKFVSSAGSTLTDPDQVKAWGDAAKVVAASKLPFGQAREKQYKIYDDLLGNITAQKVSQGRAQTQAKGQESQSFRYGQADARQEANTGNFELDKTDAAINVLQEAIAGFNSGNATAVNNGVSLMARATQGGGVLSDNDVKRAIGDASAYDKIVDIVSRQAWGEMSPYLVNRIKVASSLLLKEKLAQVSAVNSALRSVENASTDAEYREGRRTYRLGAMSKYRGLLRDDEKPRRIGGGSAKPKAKAKEPDFLKELEAANAGP